MKVWQVTRDYFDGDHDHGYYDYGFYKTEELARKAAEKVADFLVNEYDEKMKNSSWKIQDSHWNWCEKYPNTIEILCGEWDYISVTEEEVLTEIKENIEETKPSITYT